MNRHSCLGDKYSFWSLMAYLFTASSKLEVEKLGLFTGQTGIQAGKGDLQAAGRRGRPLTIKYTKKAYLCHLFLTVYSSSVLHFS